jgi:DNA-binding NarL/FixJ family response regulator
MTPGLQHALVVDDHAVVRMGAAQLLRELQPDLRVSQAETLKQAEALLQAHGDIALVLLDLHLPDTPVEAPLAGLRRLRREHPLLAVAMLSADGDPQLAAAALREGAAGWLPKSADPQLLRAALTLVLQGGCYVPPGLIERSEEPPTEHLTERQLDVLAQLVAGVSNKEIARALGLSESTVKTHLSAIFRVLKARNRTQAVNAGRQLLAAR